MTIFSSEGSWREASRQLRTDNMFVSSLAWSRIPGKCTGRVIGAQDFFRIMARLVRTRRVFVQRQAGCRSHGWAWWWRGVRSRASRCELKVLRVERPCLVFI